MNTSITQRQRKPMYSIIVDHLNGYWDMLWNAKMPLLFGGGTSTLLGFAFDFDAILKIFSVILPILIPMIISAIWTWRMNKAKKEIQVKSFEEEQKRKDDIHTFEQIKHARLAGLIPDGATNDEILLIIKKFESGVDSVNNKVTK